VKINRWFRRLLLVLISTSLIFQPAAFAQQAPAQNDLCPVLGGAVVPFFNGVLTTFPEAREGAAYLRSMFETTLPSGETVRYEAFYNWSNGFEDFVETFEQRMQEQEILLSDRFELLWEAVRGGGSITDTLVQAFPRIKDVISGLKDGLRANAVNLMTSLISNPPTIANYMEHRARLDSYVLEGKMIVMVAHSQGNLFGNVAYDYISPRASPGSVQMVHIAPASPTLRGPHTLADKDLVINGLRLAGTVASNTDVIPGYLSRPPGINNKRDVLGHGLAEIYLNPGYRIGKDLVTGETITSPLTRISQHMTSAFNTVVRPPARSGTTGFFTVFLTWDGEGDVDLHIFEPSGNHVYHRSRTGASGVLDVDTTTASGPEHFYATCNSAKLIAGDYRIGINNYHGATGRTATVQVASWRDGILSTQQLSVGAERGSLGDSSPIPVLTVSVDRNPNTGAYTVSARAI
jgi:hypothetical protein